MQIIHDTFDAPFSGAPGESVIAIGNFDGVHKGHRKLLEALGEKREGITRRVITFSPHPKKVLGDQAFVPIYREEDKFRLIEQTGFCDELLVLPFEDRIRTMRATDFFHELLLKRYKAVRLLVGDNFRFGFEGECDAKGLREMVKSSGIEGLSLEIMTRVRALYQPISSSRIRSLIREGAVKEANRMLVEPFFVEGVVQAGKGEGRRKSFPTINIWGAKDTLLPRNGVYISQTLVDGRVLRSITNVGSNPTFHQEGIHTETFIFDFDEDLYGKTCRLHFLSFIRPEKSFASEEALYEQIQQDVRVAKSFFK